MPNHASMISPNGYSDSGRLKSGWATAEGGHVSREQMAQMSPEDRRAMIDSFAVSLPFAKCPLAGLQNTSENRGCLDLGSLLQNIAKRASLYVYTTAISPRC